MKTQEQIQKEIKTLNEMGNTETARWFQAKVDEQNWETWHNVPIDEAKKMITYCLNCRIDFSIDFKHEEN